jgi:hypothetical protein
MIFPLPLPIPPCHESGPWQNQPSWNQFFTHHKVNTGLSFSPPSHNPPPPLRRGFLCKKNISQWGGGGGRGTRVACLHTYPSIYTLCVYKEGEGAFKNNPITFVGSRPQRRPPPLSIAAFFPYQCEEFYKHLVAVYVLGWVDFDGKIIFNKSAPGIYSFLRESS